MDRLEEKFCNILDAMTTIIQQNSEIIEQNKRITAGNFHMDHQSIEPDPTNSIALLQQMKAIKHL